MADSPAAGIRIAASARFPDSVESRSSWIAATLAIGILSISYGAPLIVVIGLKPIAAALDADRSVIALAAALVWVGTGIGGILMGWVADRVGVRRTVVFGALMTALGLVVSATGHVSGLYLGHALLIGFLGGGALYPPLLIYISRWFDRRRGTALALISSGQYIAGVVWPSVFERAIVWFGWQGVMLGFAAVLLLIVPMALMLSPPPQPSRATALGAAAFRGTTALRLRPNTVQAHAVRRVISLLRADGDAVEPPRRLLQRCRDRAGAGCGDAVGIARLRFCQPAVLGLGRRPDRRSRHGVCRIGLPGIGDRRILGDAQRGRTVRNFCRIWARL